MNREGLGMAGRHAAQETKSMVYAGTYSDAMSQYCLKSLFSLNDQDSNFIFYMCELNDLPLLL